MIDVPVLLDILDQREIFRDDFGTDDYVTGIWSTIDNIRAAISEGPLVDITAHEFLQSFRIVKGSDEPFTEFSKGHNDELEEIWYRYFNAIMDKIEGLRETVYSPRD